MMRGHRVNGPLLMHTPRHPAAFRAMRCRCDVLTGNGQTVPPGNNGQVNPRKLTSQVLNLAAIVEKAQNSLIETTRQRDMAREEAAVLRAQLELERASRAGLEAENQALRTQLARNAGSLSRRASWDAPQQDSGSTPHEAEVDTIVLHYNTGWSPAYIHYNPDGQGWTKPPGVALQSVDEGTASVEIPGTSLEFVMTNGNGLWDKPDTRHGTNYVIKKPGSYFLEAGRLRAA
eukprot:jgi/Botrbrau1/22694/Bobra.0132s0035.1